MANEVVFKGVRDGLLVLLPEMPVDQAVAAMVDKMEQNRAFFEGGNCPVYISGEIDEWTMEQLRALLGERFGLNKVECVARREAAETPRVQEAKSGARSEHEAYALSIEGTVRNGQRITYQGDLIVIGDANPGSQLIAGGNVLVFGALRGTAHAGALGDDNACIVAFQLQPTQIRIGQHIARPPEGLKKPDCPEIAKVRNDRIEIAPYLASKAQSGGFR